MEQFDFTDSPLYQDTEGRIRVKGSRVTLDTLVSRYKQGKIPKEIKDGFPSLSVAQINGAITWYLNHIAEAEEYIRKQDEEAEALRREIESEPAYIAFSELIKRRREQLIKN